MAEAKSSYLVRVNCEYSIQIEATNEDEAMAKANTIDLSEWGRAWSSIEAENA